MHRETHYMQYTPYTDAKGDMLATSITAHEPQGKTDGATAAMEIPRTKIATGTSGTPLSPFSRSFGVLVDDVSGCAYDSTNTDTACDLSCEVVSEESLSMSVDDSNSNNNSYALTDYLPRLEEDFCRNFTCCGVYLDNLHQLQNHYEAEHKQVQRGNVDKVEQTDEGGDDMSMSNMSNMSSRSSTSSGNSQGAVSTPASSIHSDIQSHKLRLSQAHSPLTASSSSSSSISMPGTPMMDMEMDFGVRVAGAVDNAYSTAVPRSFSGCITPHMLHPAAMARQQSQSQSQHQQLHHQQPSHPHKSVPVSMSSPLSGFYAQPPLAPQPNAGRRGPFASLQPQPARSTTSTAAKAAASVKGLSNQSNMSNTNTHIPFTAAVHPPANPQEEKDRDKPYKCPIPGCNKAYKQQNGLKYHRSKGQCSFQQQKHNQAQSREHQLIFS
ncbi:hypothetical protein E3P78_01971 [Wallemia ichthyophaga]|nr:hypothetical protein E3P78_01971 [Wallemia ichthyophaga]